MKFLIISNCEEHSAINNRLMGQFLGKVFNIADPRYK